MHISTSTNPVHMKCSVCKKEGHNKRTCKGIPVSIENVDTSIVEITPTASPIASSSASPTASPIASSSASPIASSENTSWKEYEVFIRNHPHYDFLPKEHTKSWVCVAKKGEINKRMTYWDAKKTELVERGQISKESKSVNVARYIHPTKKHVCAMCGVEHSIYYEYPTENTWKWLKKTFDYNKESILTIFEIYAILPEEGKKVRFEKYFKKSMTELESSCKSDKYTGNKLSPGVMSNAPDRLDGFHTYNSICGCRKQHDKGRSDENMKSYVRDRRAYEYFADGNCLVANHLMGKLNTVIDTCFICHERKTMTADHIGPISLGFIHDPLNFQACCDTCNSTKGNRITESDVIKIKSMEEKEICLVSWYAKDAWEKNKDNSVSVLHDNMDKNMKKFLSVMEWLKTEKSDVLNHFITTIYMDHDKSCTIRDIQISITGDITFQCTETVTGKKTKEVQKERTKEVLMEINGKNNRKIKITLSEEEISCLSGITLESFKSTICKVLAGLSYQTGIGCKDYVSSLES